MVFTFLKFQMHNPNFDHRRRRVMALRLKDWIPLFVLVLFLYLWWFSSIVRTVIRNERIIALNDIPLNLNDINFDVALLKSLPKNVNNGGADQMQESQNQSSNSPTPPPYQEANDTTLSPPPPPPVLPPPPPALTQHQIQEQQLNNIVDALIGAGDFAGWANLLSSADLSSLPVTATFFIPGNTAMSLHQPTPGDQNFNLDPFLIAYHIIPQRLAFSDLQLFKPNTRLPTLLPSKFIVVTNSSLSNFTIDDSQITYPDLYVNSAFTVHGVSKVLDYSVYGADPLFAPSPPNNTNTVHNDTTNAAPPSPTLKPKTVFFPDAEGEFPLIDDWRSSNSTTTSVIDEFVIVFTALFVMLVV